MARNSDGITSAFMKVIENTPLFQEQEAARQAAGTITHVQRVRLVGRRSDGATHLSSGYEPIGETVAVDSAWRAALGRQGFTIGRLITPSAEGHNAIIATQGASGEVDLFATVEAR